MWFERKKEEKKAEKPEEKHGFFDRFFQREKASEKEAETAKITEAAKIAEEAEKAEAAKIAEEAEKAEAARIAEEAEKAEAARIAKEAEKAEAAKIAETIIEPEKKGFWGKTWDVLNRPIFTIDESWLGNLQDRLSKTREEFVQKVRRVVLGHTRVDEDLLQDLEEILLESDVGVSVSEEVIDHLRKKAKAAQLSPEDIPEEMGNYLEGYLGEGTPIRLERGKFNVVMVVGVNGTGKTTTVGKLANRFQAEGFKPLIAAADTFRAAAIEQLEIWGKRADVPVIRHKEGGDSAAVVFDSIKAGQARGADVLLIDTAGRLHNKANLMSELEKIRRIVDREAPDAYHEVLLVLDATTGQNGLKQAEVFKEIVKLTGVVLTKLDGTAKGGVIFSIARDLGIPVKAIGLGEKLEDLKDFNPKLFVKALFGGESEE
ncbi:MAG TPA: signal recognition particle-docking protein FtsY [Cyanobacteria bacterium UBA8530]|nr:signal recognition particle-docking protein FtsY [Cyanobacteria bacterium UBA8530]